MGGSCLKAQHAPLRTIALQRSFTISQSIGNSFIQIILLAIITIGPSAAIDTFVRCKAQRYSLSSYSSSCQQLPPISYCESGNDAERANRMLAKAKSEYVWLLLTKVDTGRVLPSLHSIARLCSTAPEQPFMAAEKGADACVDSP